MKSEPVFNDQFNDRSDEVRDIMSRPPRMILKWGIAVIVVSVLSILITASFVSFHDVVQGKVKLTSEIPPVGIETKSTGRLTDVYIKNGEKVTKGQLLAVIENTATLSDVFKLKSHIESFEPDRFSSLDSFLYLYPYHLRVGPIQDDYTYFLAQFQTYLTNRDLQPNKREIETLSEQLIEQTALLSNQKNQLELYEEQLRLSKMAFQRNEKLFRTQTISELDMENATKSYLADKERLEGLRITISNTNIAIANLKSLKTKATITMVEVERACRQRLQEGVLRVKNALEGWEQLYVLKSPLNGFVTVFDIWNSDQYVKTGQILFTVVPEKNNGIIGKINLPVRNSGKVKPGQKVIIRLDSYPYEEWGSISGIVVGIAAVPKLQEPYYIVDVDIDDLNTSFNRRLEFRQEMEGTAYVIANELTIFDRVIFQLRKASQRP